MVFVNQVIQSSHATVYFFFMEMLCLHHKSLEENSLCFSAASRTVSCKHEISLTLSGPSPLNGSGTVFDRVILIGTEGRFIERRICYLDL